MAVQQKSFKDVSADMKTNYQRALDALQKNNLEYGLMLLKGIVQKEPGFIEAREQLRKAERTHTAKLGLFAKLMSGLKISGIVTAGKTLLAAKKPLEAMRKAEDALAINLSSIPALNLLAQAGNELNANFITIEALEIAREYHPKNIAILSWLADAYADAKEGVKALKIRQEIANMKPNDLDAQQKLRAAAALASMEQGKWLQGEDYRTKLKDESQAVKLEQEDRIARAADDVANLIVEYEKQYNEGKQTLEVKRKLADLYQKAERHDKAIEFYNLVVQEMGSLDPHIDSAIEKSTVAQMQQSILQWEEYAKNNPDKKDEAEKNIESFKEQIMAYRLERATDRVNRYPNDLQLRYELALIYWENNMIDDALQQFQLSQKNPQRRLSSIVYIGGCFAEK
ncbi:MAG TPA: hypothetical protein P5270_07570, partial [Victivallales bacterium]|nr:hypothetical protein [Victivallales bacterium]